MTTSLHQVISIDLPAALAGTLAAVACAVLGNFLVLRRMSLMGDAISHAVLPGLVAAFLLFGTRAWPAMFVGAAATGIATVLLVELVRRLARLESGAAMGVVFSVLFALGVLLMHRAAARNVDLDANCVLNGQLEHVFWFPPDQWSEFWTIDTFVGGVDPDTGVRSGGLPRQVWTLAVVALLAILFVTAFFKELRLAAFDPRLATTLGFRASWLHVLLMSFVAIAVVASFEAVGSILVIAMLICPPATARMLTDRLSTQIVVSILIAIVCGVGGYALAVTAPVWLGPRNDLSASGMMTVVAGGLLTAAIVFGPRHGVLARQWHRQRLAARVAREDALAILWRLAERGRAPALEPSSLRSALGGGLAARLGIRLALNAAEVERSNGAIALTESGEAKARTLMRSHRLWETYLVEQLGVAPDHVHDTAMRLEHVTDQRMRDELARDSSTPDVDPHGHPIPKGDQPSHPGRARE